MDKTTSLSFSDLLSFSDSFVEIDPRIDRCKVHYAESIVFIAISGVLCGCESWNDLEDFAHSKEAFFREKLPRFHGVPSHDTFCRFFSALDPDKFETNYRQWISNILGDYCGHVAIDGKTICGAYESELEHRLRGSGCKKDFKSFGKLHMVSAYATEAGVSLGQIKVEDKSNEITAIPQLIDELCIRGNTFTIDAMGCQKEIAKKIIEREGDYILVVKDNQRSLRNQIQQVMPGEIAKNKAIRFDKAQSSERNRSRTETRTCYCCAEAIRLGPISEHWKGMQSFGYIDSTRKVKGQKKPTLERRYFISSLKMDAKRIMEMLRNHWKIENELHWQLDVNFHEDYTRKKNVAAQNFSLLAKIALAALKNNKRKKPINRKRKVAGWDNEYLWELITTNIANRENTK